MSAGRLRSRLPGSEGQEEGCLHDWELGEGGPQFFCDGCERVAVTGDTVNYLSYSIATANPIASANPGEGTVSPSVLGLSTVDRWSPRARWPCETEARGEGKLGMDVTRIEVENKVGFPVNLNLIAGHVS